MLFVSHVPLLLFLFLTRWTSLFLKPQLFFLCTYLYLTNFLSLPQLPL